MLLQAITDYLREITKNHEYDLHSEITFEIGPQYNFTEKIVKKVLVTQNLTMENILYARKMKFNLIICRYGIIPHLLNHIDEPTQKLLLLLLQSRIMVCLLPTSWDYSEDGPIDFLCNLLDLNFQDPLYDMAEFLGRMYKSNPSQRFEDILSKLHRNLNMDVISAFSNTHDFISKVFLCFPESISPQKIIHSSSHQCDCSLGTEISSTAVTLLRIYNISFIQIPYSLILEPALQKLCAKLAVEFPRIEFIFYPTKSILQSHKRKQNH